MRSGCSQALTERSGCAGGRACSACHLGDVEEVGGAGAHQRRQRAQQHAAPPAARHQLQGAPLRPRGPRPVTSRASPPLPRLSLLQVRQCSCLRPAQSAPHTDASAILGRSPEFHGNESYDRSVQPRAFEAFKIVHIAANSALQIVISAVDEPAACSPWRKHPLQRLADDKTAASKLFRRQGPVLQPVIGAARTTGIGKHASPVCR